MRRILFRFAALILLLAAPFLMPVSWRDTLAGSLRDVFAPVQSAWAELLAMLHAVRDGPSLDALVEESGRLRIELSRLQALDRENKTLKAQLNFQTQAPYRLIAAEVIARDMNVWWHTLRINKGALDGLRPDMPVLSPEGLVGKIVAVSSRTADVRLLVDSDSSVSASLQRIEAFGIVRGSGVTRRGDALCRMTFLAKDVVTQQGEEVLTSGLSAIYPRGLLIGYVSRSYQDRSGLFQIADVIPAADFNALWIVFALDQASDRGVVTREMR